MKLHILTPGILLLVVLRLPAQRPDVLLLEKIHEPNEKAFTILKPSGWLAEGGIVRWDPLTSGGAANAIEAKIDFALSMDEKGTVRIHWLPEDHPGAFIRRMENENTCRALRARTCMQMRSRTPCFS